LAVEFAGQAGVWPALAQSLFASVDFRTLD